MTHEKRIKEREFQRKLIQMCKDYAVECENTAEMVGALELVKQNYIRWIQDRELRKKEYSKEQTSTQ